MTENLPTDAKSPIKEKQVDYLRLKESVEDAVKKYRKTDGNWNGGWKKENGKLNVE